MTKRIHWLPGTIQSPTAPREVSPECLRPCPACGRRMPAHNELVFAPDGRTLIDSGTFTAVCPFCKVVTLGAEPFCVEYRQQERCFDCDTELAGARTCAKCGMARAWMTVPCPFCGKPQATSMPHWASGCDRFHFDCMACGREFNSLCIC